MPLPYPLCVLVLSRNCWDKEPQKATKGSLPPGLHSASLPLPHPSKVQAPESFHPFPTLFVSSAAASMGLGLEESMGEGPRMHFSVSRKFQTDSINYRSKNKP